MKRPNKLLLLSLLVSGFGFVESKLTVHASTIKEERNRSVCTMMSGISNLGAVNITGYNGVSYKTHYARKFNSCSGLDDDYSSLGNIFYRTNYGGIVTYQHIPQKNYREYTAGDSWNWGQLKENADSTVNGRSYFKTWGVKLNSLACRDAHVDTCATKLSTPNTYKTFSYDESSGLYKKTTKGESRYLGYSANGTSITNVYLPLDNSASGVNTTWSDLSKYPFDDNVFTTSTNSWFKPTKSEYDKNTATKKAAVTRLLKDIPELKKLGGVDSWMNRVSLRTDPVTEAPVFEATRDDGAGYVVLTLTTPEEFNRNVSLVEMRIETTIDGKTYTAAKMTRDNDDNNVTVSFGKYNGETIKLEQGETYTVKVIVKNTSPSKVALSGANYLTYNDKETSKGSNLAYGATQEFSFSYKAPEKATDTLYAKVGTSYGANNQQYHDDDASLTINLKAKPKGDLQAGKAELVEAKTNKVVKYPVQGMEYFIRYYVKYDGETQPNKYDINLNVSINTYQPHKDNGSLVNKIVTTTLDSKVANSELKKDGTKIVFESQKFKATSSKIKTDYTISVPKTEDKINTNTSNDSASETFEEKFDIVIKESSVKIQPTRYPGGDYCQPIVIKYEVIYNAPVNHAYSEAQTVKVAFNVGGKLAETTIQVYANQGYKQYSFTYDPSKYGCVNGDGNDDGSIPIGIVVNPYHSLHEKDYTNNDASKKWEKVTYAQDYCATISNEDNKWTQQYYVISVNDAALSPDLDSFDKEESIKITQNETFKITSVQFYSKYMKDKKWGDNRNGWVEVLNSDTGKQSTGYIPTIKAGYGFDIKVTVEYTTDAFTSEKEKIGTLKDNQTLYAPHAISQFNDDFYLVLKTKGMSNQGATIISAKGGNNQNNTSVKPSSTSSGSVTDKLTMTYTFEDVRISEGTPDGFYHLSLYTKPIDGVIDKSEYSSSSALCDYLNVQFKVNGSIYDDVITGTIK